MAGATSTFVAGENPLKDNLALFLVQSLVIICLSRFLAMGFRYINQPQVIAEVIGGILLGPSALSRSAAFKNNVFPQDSLPRLGLVANFALIFFLFLVGLELDPTTLMKKARQSASISLSGIVLPFAAGAGVSKIIYTNLTDETVPFYAFFVFLGVCMSITAFPVLARILNETKILRLPVGQITLASAAVDDAVAWCLLILTVALINNPSDAVRAVYVFLITMAWAVFLFVAVRPQLLKLVRRRSASEGVSPTSLLVIFILILISSFFTQAVGVHAIFGGFLVGLITPHDHGFAIKLTEKIEDFVTILLLPLYFAYSGLNVNIFTLNDASAWGYVFLVILIACGGKIIGCTAAARMTGFGWRESLTVGFLMNTKGLVELIVLNLGLEAGVINQKIFTIFVLMAVATTCMTTPIVSWLYPASRFPREPRDHHILSITSQSAKELEKGSSGDLLVGGNASTNIMVCLPSMHTVPAMMNITAMCRSTQSHLSIFALRLIKLTERTSTYLMASNQGETMRADPVINVFRTFGQLNHVSVHTLVNVSSSEDFARNIRDTSESGGVRLIILPWQQSSFSNKDSCLNDKFIKDSVEEAPCSVAVFIDRGFGVSSNPEVGPEVTVPGQNQRLFVPFFGRSDEREALRFVAYLASHPGLSITILDMRGKTGKRDSDEATKIDMDGPPISPMSISDADDDELVLEHFRSASGNVVVETYSEPLSTESSASHKTSSSVVMARASAFGRKDLIVVGYSTLMSQPELRSYFDLECESSVAIVKLHHARSLGSSDA